MSHYIENMILNGGQDMRPAYCWLTWLTLELGDPGEKLTANRAAVFCQTESSPGNAFFCLGCAEAIRVLSRDQRESLCTRGQESKVLLYRSRGVREKSGSSVLSSPP